MPQRPIRALVLACFMTLLAVPVFAGYCSGGPVNGQSCSFNFQCGSWCNGGPVNHSSCSYDFQCGKTCAGGSAAGYSCSYDFQCPGSYCRQWYCQFFYCVGGSGFTATGTASEGLAKPDSLEELFASLSTK